MDNMNKIYLLIGTYTKQKSEGIYVYSFDTETGDTEYVSMAKAENPSYLAISKDSGNVYAVSENETAPSFVNAFSFDDRKGMLTFLNKEEAKGDAPCNITVDPDKKYLVTANYGGGSLSVFGINDEGSITSALQVIAFGGQGINKERQEAPHIHCVKFSPDNKFLFATDLGTDKIYRFETDNSGEGDYLKEESLMLFKVEDGSGPRHIEFHPSGKYLYLINELSGTVIGFTYDEGNLTEFQTIVADKHNAAGSGDIGITPDGKYLYASNRLENDGIMIYSINETTGELSETGYQHTGIHPRNFVISPDGKFLLVANMHSNQIQIFRINQSTGLLDNIHQDIQIDMPVCLKFVNAGTKE